MDNTNSAVDFAELVHRAVESDELDYKSAMNWNLMPRPARLKILRHCVALANTKGGFLVIGVGEDASGHPSVLQGLNREEVHSFDPSAVGSFFTQYVEPALDFTIERPMIDGKRYAIFVVKPFVTLPHVCTRDGEGELRQGVFYIRTQEAASRPAMRAFEMHALVMRALRHQRSELGKLFRGIMDEKASETLHEEQSESRYDDEYHDALNYFQHRKKIPDDHRIITITVRPKLVYLDGRFTLTELRNAVEKSVSSETSSFLDRMELEQVYFANASLRLLPPERNKLVLFTRSGMVLFAGSLPPNPRQAAKALLQSVSNFCDTFYHELGFRQEELKIQLESNGRTTTHSGPATGMTAHIRQLLAGL